MEIWVDVTCPWCAAGRRHLETALERFPHRDDVEIRWRSFELDPASGRTFDAHRLLHLATEHGVQDELQRLLMRTYADGGADPGDAVALARLAEEAGVPADEVRDVLAGERYANAVRDDEALARSVEMPGVPFFAVDRDLAVSGAQSPDVLLELLQQSWARAAARGG